MDRNRIQNAYHEAGHAVMSILHGQAVVSVDIHHVDTRGGIMRSLVLPYQSRPTTLAGVVSLFQITLAGPLAAGIFDCGWPGALDEIYSGAGPHWLEGGPGKSLWGGGNDFSVLRPYAAKLWQDPRERAQRVNDFAFETIRRLTRYEVWRVVDDIADALQDAGEVGQWELERIAGGLTQRATQ